MILPADFISETRSLLGSEYPLLEAALQARPTISIRLNPAKGLKDLPADCVAWCDTGYYLPERPAFTFDPLFHAGAYYVQEASSMFLEQAIRTYAGGPVKCLDLCAAPGGKSTHLLTALPGGSLLVSNEVIRSRSYILAENTTKWGSPHVIVTHNDPEEIGGLTHFFDMIVVDAPCSGEGMFRKNPESISEWSAGNVALCASRQRRILHDSWGALKPGGILIYSTCTYNLEENEENLHYILAGLGAEALSVPVKEAWNITGPLKYSYPVYRFFPHKTKGEGFFLAVVRKKEDGLPPYRKRPEKEKGKAKSAVPAAPCHWLLQPEAYQIEMRGHTITAFPQSATDDLQTIAARLQIVSSGVSLGEVKGRDVVPCHSLAMSTAFNRAAFPVADLTWPDAIRYLRKEAVALPAAFPKGYALATYKGCPLGFVKHIGNRSNNLYPQEWRIRTECRCNPNDMENKINARGFPGEESKTIG
ncbi:MAG: rRNA cytosine-C5-methyltransferase [Tannerellaceae bacterium]|jgi:16S rRNA C967 or C1407 C5-methylase (RsmB/RsmF family)/NOL1/NOP2/fmu family ribosome biogenesis protein|nr:rRNA cytosine-C5-methyltransferase [Tannerellaceae bacterium]